MFVKNLAFLVFTAVPALAPALEITVAPTNGVAGTAVTDTIADAITQINSGPDTDNTIKLRSSEGPHFQPTDTTWSITAGKNITFSPEADDQPVVLLQSAGARYMLTIAAGTDAPNQTETIVFNDIIFIPQTGLSYANNIADGFDLNAGNFEFNGCIFSNNDGSNGPASTEGDVEYAPAANNVGDDWIQMNSQNTLTMNNCTVTGANDDAVLIGGATAPAVSHLNIAQGTCIANNGGAGIQIFEDRNVLTIDGTNGRIMVADNGKRAPNDVGIKFFGDVDCAVNINGCDIVGNTHSGFFDFSGIPTISIANTRFAFNNTTNQDKGSHFSVWEADPTPDSGGTNQIINFTNVTMHDVISTSQPDGIDVEDNADTPMQTYTIKDCIFSGASDSYVDMTNSAASGGASPAPTVSFTAVVTNGADALADAGELGSGQVNDDPQYVSTDYVIGRGEENPNFLLPSGSAYATASSTGGLLRGGAPQPSSGVTDYMLY